VAAPLAIAAAAAIVLAVGRAGHPTEPVPPPLAFSVPDLPDTVSGVAARVSRVVAHTPLDTELENLLHDGRRGLDEVLAAGGLR
jgi:hypothetical protein